MLFHGLAVKECEHAEKREKLASTRVSQSAIPPTETPQQASLSEKRAARKKPSLGPKKQDLSQYLESAKLTQRQYECTSLHFEYDLSLQSQVAFANDLQAFACPFEKPPSWRPVLRWGN